MKFINTAWVSLTVGKRKIKTFAGMDTQKSFLTGEIQKEKKHERYIST